MEVSIFLHGQWPLLMILILELGGQTVHYYLVWIREEVIMYVLFASYHEYSSLHLINSDFVAK